MKGVQYLTGYFSRLISEGTLGKGDPHTYAEYLVSLVFGYAIGLVSLQDKPQIDESLDCLDKMVTDIFLPGIKTEKE